MAPPGGRSKRIIVLCEGDTEELALRHFILRQWTKDGLTSTALHPINLNGRLQNVGHFASRYLDEPEIMGVFTLVDLQGMDRVIHSSDDELDAKVKRVCDWLKGQIGHPRKDDFSPHLAVHQTEAWILAEGLALSKRLMLIGLLQQNAT